MRFFDFTLKQTKDYQSVTEHPRASANFQSVPALSQSGEFPQIFAVSMEVVLGIMRILCIPFKILLFG